MSDTVATAPISGHELLLGLAGHVDDDLLAIGRELVAVGEEAVALELLVASLTAAGTTLGHPVRTALAQAAEQRVGPDIARLLPPGVPPPDRTAHVFGPDAGDPDAVARIGGIVRGLAVVARSGARPWLTWRLTPAGAAPGPLPHPVVLMVLDGPGPAEVLAYQVGAALARAGVPASVEAFVDGSALPPYQRAALAAARPVGDAAPPAPEPDDDVWRAAEPQADAPPAAGVERVAAGPEDTLRSTAHAPADGTDDRLRTAADGNGPAPAVARGPETTGAGSLSGGFPLVQRYADGGRSPAGTDPAAPHVGPGGVDPARFDPARNAVDRDVHGGVGIPGRRLGGAGMPGTADGGPATDDRDRPEPQGPPSDRLPVTNGHPTPRPTPRRPPRPAPSRDDVPVNGHATDEPGWDREWSSGSWAMPADSAPAADPDIEPATSPTPSTPLGRVPPSPSPRQQEDVVSQEPFDVPQAPEPRRRHRLDTPDPVVPDTAEPGPSEDVLDSRLTPNEQELLRRLQQELAAREGGSADPQPPRNGTAHPPDHSG